ncbi:MAG: hypothetical protein HYV76_03060 [Candidatus Vogelbacteria bacterium]|nr:hypothetical protein [Candidatus Vogelbacteria bacterium]
MPPEEQRIPTDTETLAKRREQAILAMEGSARRSKRVEAERLEAEKKLAQKIHDEQIKKHNAEVAAKEAKERAAAEASARESEAAKASRIAKGREAATLTEQLRGEPRVSLSSVRTLKTDVQDAASSRKLSMAKIALEAQALRRQSAKQVEHQAYTTIAIIALTLVLLAGGGLVIAYVFKLNPIASTTITPQTAVKLILPTDTQYEVITSGETTETLLPKVRRTVQASGPTDSTTGLYFTKVIAEIDEDDKTLEAKAVLGLRETNEILGIELPRPFIRFLNNNWLLGLYHTPTGTEPFIILTINSYENIAAQLLAHGSSILAPLIKPYFPDTSYNTLKTVPPAGGFTDLLIKNIDARAIVDTNGQPHLLYAFIDNQTLVITISPATMEKVVALSRLPVVE